MSKVRASATHRLVLVPMHLDALCLAQPRQVREALADYTRMPFVYTGKDGKFHHANAHANISEIVLSQAFSSRFQELGAGVHLHWALPDAMTHSVESDDRGHNRFPIVPNRWLVTRSRGATVERQWVVESDFLHPDLSGIPELGPAPRAVTIPFPHTHPRKGPQQPYRHLGRSQPLADWNPTAAAERLRTFGMALTAIGPFEQPEAMDHVKGTFAAFYPGCFSVFGFHDTDTTLGANPVGVTYEVIGWYDTAGDDLVRAYHDEHDGESDRIQVEEDFKARFRWEVDLGGKRLPGRSACYARLGFSAVPQASRAARSHSVGISVGATGTEALSAFLAHSIDPKKKALLEQQLDALEFTDQLENRQLDLGAKFHEARHERGFTGHTGGVLWSIQRVDPSGGEGQELTLPDDVAALLSNLNHLQAEYDHAVKVTASMSQRLFNDWHKYMYAAHPQGLPGNSGPDDPGIPARDLKNAWNTIAYSDLYPLRRHRHATGKLALQQNRRTLRVTGRLEPLRLGIVTVHQKTFYGRYVDNLSASNLANNSYWGKGELGNMGITLSSSARATQVQAGGEDDEGRSWHIVDGSKTYRVVVERGIMNLYIPPNDDQLAARLARAVEQLQHRVGGITPPCVLEATSAPRFWQPNDPVVLMVGDTVVPSARHGHDGRLRADGRLDCHILENVADDALDRLAKDAALLKRVRDAIAALATSRHEQIGLKAVVEQPWNPFLLEWDTQFFPHPVVSDTRVAGAYPPGYVTSRYTLAPEAVDLAIKGHADRDFVVNAEPYRGLSILTPSADGLLRSRIAGYVVKQRTHLPKKHSDALYGLTLEDAERYVEEHAQAILAEYQPGDDEEAQALLTALHAAVKLRGMPSLSQALGGFHDALLMQKRTMQLAIEDPIGSDDDQLLATQVAGTVDGPLLMASNPLQEWNPVRAGELRITSLRLVDTFGQINDLSTDPTRSTLVSSELMPLRVSGTGDHRVVLSPRLAQPARILFRWLSASPIGDEEQPETNAHPATSPVCGFLVPNNLDRSLLVYDAEGGPLGVLNTVGHWDPAPGTSRAVPVEAISNRYLRRVVEHLTSAGRAGAAYTLSFLQALDTALDQSDPETFAHGKALSLLIGRPLAVVRAAVDLELLGLPERDKHWRIFKETIAEYDGGKGKDKVTPISRSPVKWTRGFDGVTLPIRIGEFRQLNDGLVGYWRETPEGRFEADTFYAPQSEHAGFGGAAGDGRRIVTEKSGPVNVHQTVGDPALRLTMLMDPRGVVHASSGLVPAKSIRIPPDHYVKALEAMEVTFVASPILTPSAAYVRSAEGREVRVPVPRQPGFAWSWLSRHQGAWEATPHVAPVETQARLADTSQLSEGWLRLTRDDDNEQSPNDGA